MAHQDWDAGYAEGFAAGLEGAWARVSAAIERGPRPRDRSERRNGLLLACRGIAYPKPHEVREANLIHIAFTPDIA